MRYAVLLLILGLSVGCGDDDSRPTTDTGTRDGGTLDTGTADAGADAGVDGGTDAGADAGTDAATDGGSDAGVDAAMDAATDAGLDGGADAAMDAGMATCDPVIDLFPVPVDETTTLFDDIDDGALSISFTRGFTFPFYGETYAGMVLGTNGGMVFGSDPSLTETATELDVVSADILVPTIAPFWGDLDAGVDIEATGRAMQVTIQQCDDSYVIRYTDYSDHDDPTWQNTATVTLFDDGEVEFAYGTVESEDIMVGVFDGTHSSDATITPPFAATYPFGGGRSGVILFDAQETDAPQHLGELNDRVIRFTP